MKETLSIDWGTGIVGVLDIATGIYVSYRHDRIIEGARRISLCTGAIVTFNGNRYDIPATAKALGVEELALSAKHFDMLELTSEERWPPHPGTRPIMGTSLERTYQHYFQQELPALPRNFLDNYEFSNWKDCFMAAELWKLFERKDLLATQKGHA